MGCSSSNANSMPPRASHNRRRPTSISLVVDKCRDVDGEDTSCVHTRGKDSKPFLSEEEALVYVQQELRMDEERAMAVLETIPRSGRGLSSHDLVTINTKIKEVKQTLEPKFIEFDPTNSGFVTPEDAVSIMSRVFPGLPPVTLESMVKEFDKDMNKKVDFGEFILFHSCVQAKKKHLDQWLDEMNDDNSKDLQTEELCQILTRDCGLRELQARMLIQDFDVDKNGSIDRVEFNQMWTKLFE